MLSVSVTFSDVNSSDSAAATILVVKHMATITLEQGSFVGSVDKGSFHVCN